MILHWASRFSYYGDPTFAQLFPVTPAVVTPVFVPSRAQVFPPSILLSGADAQLFINNVQVQWLANPGDSRSTSSLGSGVSFSSPTITKILGQNGTFNFAFLSTNGTLPQAYDDVVFYRNGVRRFGGFVTAVSDVVIVSTKLREYGVQCVDYNGLMDRLVVGKLYTLPLGALISIIIADFVFNPIYLSQFGVTYAFEGDPGVDLGVILFHYMYMSQAVQQLLTNASGWYVFIDEYKALHLRAQSTSPAAPYSLTDTSDNFECMSVTQQNSEYRNRQWVLPSVNTQSFWTDTFTGDGSEQDFFTQYVINQTPVVTLNGNPQVVMELSSITGPYDWYWIKGGQGVFQNFSAAPITALDTLAVTYPSPFQLAVMAENATEIALRGVVESIYSPTDAINQIQAQNLAEALLANYCPSIPQQIEFNTNEHIEPIAGGWLEVGTLIHATTTSPLANGYYLVQQITSQENNLTIWKHNIIARLQNGATDYQTVLQKLTQQALSTANNTDQVTLIFELGTTIPGITNPGLATGLVPNVQLYPATQPAGVIAQWSLIFPTDPPTGADLQIDILQNGTSIFPAGVYATLPAGQATEEDGILFKSINIAVNPSDTFTLNVIQVGSGNPGTNGVLQLIVRF